MLGSIPTKLSRGCLPDLVRKRFPKGRSFLSPKSLLDLSSAENDEVDPTPHMSKVHGFSYFAVCFFYALGPSLLDIFLSPMTQEIVKNMLDGMGWTSDAHLAAYLYAVTLSAYAFAKCGSAPFMGLISDQLGRQTTITFTLLVTAICLFTTGYCTSWISLLLCRFFTGLFANGGLLTAYAADIGHSMGDRSTLFSYFITAWAFARITAAWLFIKMGEKVRYCCLFATGCEILAATLTYLFFFKPPEKKMHGKSLMDKVMSPLAIIRDRPSLRAAFREMLRDRLVALLFITSLLSPRIDVSRFLWQTFRQGPSAVGYIKAIESVTVIIMPLTPLSYILTRRLGYANAAVACAGFSALCWVAMTQASGMRELYTMVFLRSAVHAVYEPSVKSIMMDSADRRHLKREHIGSFAGLQQSMKGAAQVLGSFWGSFLASYSSQWPVLWSAVISLANASIIYQFCVVCSIRVSSSETSLGGGDAQSASLKETCPSPNSEHSEQVMGRHRLKTSDSEGESCGYDYDAEEDEPKKDR